MLRGGSTGFAFALEVAWQLLASLCSDVTPPPSQPGSYLAAQHSFA